MCKIYLILVYLISNSLCAFAQSDSGLIKGSVKEIDDNKPLSNANIMLLRAQDSIIYISVRTDKSGNFQIENIIPGNYILVASYINYVDFVESFSVDASGKDFGIINMITREELMKEVVVKSQVASIRIKGDTTEFVADSFKVLPNASVEDLLKKLPGIQVDRIGNITAQGESVKKVLVDGEEFFSSDPTLVTRNFRADMVDRVQLYDKKSEQAVFTGIDDGIREKTINLKIKSDKKNGYFGKLESGYGTANFFQNQAIFNYFKGNSKLSIFGTYANTGKNGLTRDDIQKFNMSRDYSEDAGPLSTNWSGRYEGEGIPRIFSGGVHFDTKWNEEKQTFNTDYFVGDGRLTGSKNAQTITNIDADNIQTENTASDFNRRITRNKLDARYKFDIDTTLSIIAKISGLLSRTHNRENLFSTIKDKDSVAINSSARNSDFSGDTKSFGSNFVLQKKLKKAGRTVSIDLNQYFKNAEEAGNLFSEINFYKSSSTQIFDQYKKNISETNAYSAEVNYTEPLSEYSALGFIYQYNYNNSRSDRRTFGKNNGSYNLLDSLYSNDFRYVQSGNLAGLSYIYGKNNENINIGIKANFLDLQQKNLIKNTDLKRNFMDVTTNVVYNKTKGQKRFYTAYWGNTIQPTIQQLQPVMFTEDSLNIFIGNSMLNPSYNNSFSIGYEKSSVVSGKYFSVEGSYGFVINPIITNIHIDNDLGVRMFDYFNTKRKNTNFEVRADYGGKIQKWDATFSTGLNFNGSELYTSVNQILSNNQSYNIAPYLRLNKTNKEKYDINFYMETGYDFYKTSIVNVPDNNSFYFSLRTEATLLLPFKMKLHSSIDYHWRQKTQAFDKSFSTFLWNADIEKRLLKNESLILRFSANDLLNQNIGFTRNVKNNIYYETRFTTIPRYFMLSLIWDFNKVGGMVKKENK